MRAGNVTVVGRFSSFPKKTGKNALVSRRTTSVGGADEEHPSRPACPIRVDVEQRLTTSINDADALLLPAASRALLSVRMAGVTRETFAGLFVVVVGAEHRLHRWHDMIEHEAHHAWVLLNHRLLLG
ncbi:MAG: hypothetical protein ACI9KE_001265 [Polyangiales bacterium]|jgi:hypothetical protein